LDEKIVLQQISLLAGISFANRIGNDTATADRRALGQDLRQAAVAGSSSGSSRQDLLQAAVDRIFVRQQ